MTARTQVHGLKVATTLYRFIEDQVLPATGVKSATFWKGFDAVVSDLAPHNIALLAERDRIQTASHDGGGDAFGPRSSREAAFGGHRDEGFKDLELVHRPSLCKCLSKMMA